MALHQLQPPRRFTNVFQTAVHLPLFCLRIFTSLASIKSKPSAELSRYVLTMGKLIVVPLGWEGSLNQSTPKIHLIYSCYTFIGYLVGILKKILLMVAKSGDHQLRLVVEIPLSTRFDKDSRWLALGFLNHQQ